MKVKTSELSGAALDWVVAEADGTPIYRSGKTMTRMDMDGNVYWKPSTDWAQGGQIIEDECLDLEHRPAGASREWYAVSKHQAIFGSGDTPLIAAMRCFVALALGLEVEVPEDLV